MLTTVERCRVPVLAAAIGIYLPIELMVPIFLGGLIAHLVERFHKVRADDEEGRDRVHKPGVLFAAGLITGEALMGIAIAVPIVVSSRADVLAVPFHLPAAQWIGLAVLFLVGWLIYRINSPVLRFLFMAPKNHLRMRDGVVSMLAGNLSMNPRTALPVLRELRIRLEDSDS